MWLIGSKLLAALDLSGGGGAQVRASRSRLEQALV